MTILLAVALAAQLAAAPPSTFCVQERCQPVAEIPTTIAPLDTVRNFVWISSDLKRVITGTIQAGASALMIPDESQHHRFVPRLSDGATQATLESELQCQDLVWKWSMTRVPTQLMDLRHLGAGCTLQLKSPGYRTVKRQLQEVDAGNIFLQRLPVLSGTVTDAETGVPLRQADVSLPNGDVLASTDRRGAFRAPVAAEWPQLVHVSMPGYARQTVLLPRVAADTALSIRLSKGGSLTIRLADPLGHEDVNWEVRRLLAGRRSELTRTGRLSAGQTNTVVDALEPGQYLVIIAGANPLQRAGALVTLTERGNAEALIQIFPAVVEISVKRGDQPVAGATIHVDPDDGAWNSSVTTDDDGKVIEEIWQKGSYIATVTKQPLIATVTKQPLIPFWRVEERIDSDKNHWDITVPDRRLVGRIIDASSGQGIADARIVLTMKNGDGSTTVPLHSDAAGNFELRACPAGRFMLAVSKSGYEAAETTWMLIDETETEHVSEIRLKPSGNRTIAVTNAFAAPISGALVYLTTRNGTRVAGNTDDQGKLSLPVSPDDYGMVFALPRSGSIGMARFGSVAEGSDTVLLQVPDGNATLEIHCETTSGTSLSRVAILIRLNGVLLPIPVLEGMVNFQGSPMLSDGQGQLLLTHIPPGRYELWPMSREQLVAVASNSPPPAPVNIALTPGYQSARLVFASAKP